MRSYDYLGTAVDYPISIVNGSIKLATGKAVVENSIIMILTTPVGTRLFLPEYGSRLSELIFEPNDDILARLLRTYTFQAIRLWEKRVRVVNVKVIIGLDVALLLIVYQILPNGEFGVFPYPFYRNVTN